VSWRQRWRDLAALDASLPEQLVSLRVRLVCLSAYLREALGPHNRGLLRRSLGAIAQRASQLLSRRKVREMRYPAASATSAVRPFRVRIGADGVVTLPDAQDAPTPTRERW
jgi:hypothetical protein